VKRGDKLLSDELMHSRVQTSVVEPQPCEVTESPPPASPLGQRLAWSALEYPIAATANRLPYMLGGLTFFGIVLLVVTGLVLDQYYDPTPLGAHDSMVYILTRVPLGTWLRALHYWGASLVLVSVVLHLLYVFRRRSYLPPREITWWSGVTMLLLLFLFAFTGSVLRADQEGGEALAHAIAGAELVGAVGAPLTPDFAPSTSLLARLHAAHVSLLPLALFAVLGLHFWLIRYLGINATEGKTALFTTHLRRLSGFGLLLMAGLGLLALVFPPGLGFEAMAGVEVTKPFWPFLWIYAVENTIGVWGMILAPLVLFAFLFLVPVLDKRIDTQRPRWFLALAIVVLALFGAAFVYGIFAPRIQHLGM
jgi:ubiquinol-cytochrome c reductase cytochrome b subunit